jgi:uncharacterized membrane protein YoaK (UPF0700 family)
MTTRAQASSQGWLCPALAFVAGFADAASFVRADGICCAHVTGNLVVMAAALARHEPVRWLTVATIPVFVLSALLVSRLCWNALKSDPQRGCTAILTVEAAFLAVSATLGSLDHPSHNQVGVQSVIVLSLVVAMAAQNALHRIGPKLGINTTVMTGNIMQWCLERAGLGDRTILERNPNRVGQVIALFAFGCVCGAISVRLLGFGMLVIPLVVVLASLQRLRQPHARVVRTQRVG